VLGERNGVLQKKLIDLKSGPVAHFGSEAGLALAEFWVSGKYQK